MLFRGRSRARTKQVQANRVPLARSGIRKNSATMPVDEDLSELLRVQLQVFHYPARA